MSQALYRKYRSRSLDEVLGQDHVTNILRRALEQGKIAHAYLLTGPRGVGKTSVARILAHEINQLPYDEEASHLDIIEIDAASNNGVDDIRALREKAQVAPVSAPKKIYIIDEVHMLSKPAFNALLKTLEEPPDDPQAGLLHCAALGPSQGATGAGAEDAGICWCIGQKLAGADKIVDSKKSKRLAGSLDVHSGSCLIQSLR